MKILKEPTLEFEEIDITRYTINYNPFKENFLKKVPFWTDRVAGRHTWSTMVIDFEDEIVDYCTLLTEINAGTFKKKDFELNGKKYYGMFPLKHLGNNIWECHIDHIEE